MVFLTIFCLRMEGSGVGSVLVTDRCGSGRPKKHMVTTDSDQDADPDPQHRILHKQRFRPSTPTIPPTLHFPSADTHTHNAI